MKNILFLIESSETGGAESIFLELTQRIDRSRFNPHVALLYEGWLADQFRAIGIEPHMIPTSRGGFDIRLLNGIRAAIRKYDINLIHSHLFTTNVYACVCGALASIPVISTFHGTMDVDMLDVMKKLKWLIVNNFSDKIVFVSGYLMEYFSSRKLACASKSLVIYNGIDTGRFCKCISKNTARSNLGLPADSFIVGCVGDLRPAKDYETALRSLCSVKQRIPSAKIAIVGTKTAKLGELLAFANTLGIREDVFFLGYRCDMQNVFPAFDVFLSSSVSEGFSLTVVEAMVAGIPVVVTRSGGPEEIVVNNKNGILVDVGSADQISAAIVSIFIDVKAAEALSEAGKAHACRFFSVKSMVNKYNDLYAEILS